MTARSGLGWDSHRLVAGRPLILGGVTFPDAELGLDGHSDADVLTHAIMDALLGAAGLDDIGVHFPDTDPAWSGADSLGLLRRVTVLVTDAGWTPGNVDCSVVLDGPKLAPRRDEMQRALSAAAGCDVTVKGKRPEGIGALGRGEGVAAWAVAVVERP